MRQRPVRFVWLHLAAVLVVGLTPLIIFGATSLTIERHGVEEQVVRDQATGIVIVSEAFERHYVAKVRALEAFVRRISRARLTDAALAHELDELREPIGAYVISAHDREGHTTSISPLRLATGELADRPSIGHRPYFQQALAERRITVSPLLHSARGVPIVAIAAPITEGRVVRAVVVMVLDLASFTDVLTRTAWSLGRFFLVDRDRNLYQLSPRPTALELEVSSPITAQITSPEGTRRIPTADGERLISWAPIPALGITLGAEIASRDLMAQRTVGRAEHLALAGLGVFALSCAAALIVGRFAGRELHAVRDYLQALAGVRAGAEPPPPVLRVAELVQISAAGHSMARTILSREQALRILFDLDRALADAHTTVDIVRVAARHASETLGFDGAAAFLLDERTGTLTLIDTHRLPDDLAKEIAKVPFDRAVAGRAIAAGHPMAVTDDVLGQVVAPEVAQAVRAAGFQTVASTSCVAHGRTYGALSLYHRQRMELGEALLALLRSIGIQVAMAMAHAAERQQLIEQERLAALGRLAAGVGHELKNPLTVIDARIKMLDLHKADPEATARDMASLREASARMKRIMAGLSNYAKPPRAELQPLDVDELLRGITELVVYQARRTNVSIAVEVLADLPQIRAERSQLTQILVNLATNAIDAMVDGGGTLTLGGIAGADRVDIEVADTGPGIPPDRLEGIWTAFYTTKPEGTGLGLSIVRALVMEQPGATISVHSEVGRGTTFTISFPAVRDDLPR
ncbi:MAG: GAF domain-containing protein [Candidatus Rokubacteria bacterium]|nr:GAF domain-containing protein [Candidatus Rokubacteria bacterium]